MHEGSSVDVRLSLESGVVVGRGAVRWRVNAAGKAPPSPSQYQAPGMGIELISVTSGEELLDKFISRKSLIPIPEP